MPQATARQGAISWPISRELRCAPFSAGTASAVLKSRQCVGLDARLTQRFHHRWAAFHVRPPVAHARLHTRVLAELPAESRDELGLHGWALDMFEQHECNRAARFGVERRLTERIDQP